MPDRKPPILLRELLEQRHARAYDRFLRQYEETAGRVARELSEPKLAHSTISHAQYERWLRGALRNLPHPDHCRILEAMLGRPAADLFAPAPDPRQPNMDSAPQAGPAGFALGHGGPAFNLDEVIAMTAHESSEHAGMAASHNIEDTTIEQLHADVARAARSYANVSALESFVETKRIRNLAVALLDRTSRPAQMNELYLITGQVCALLATAMFDMGYYDEAEEQSRAAYMYGKTISHPGLCAWARGTQALIAYWSGRPLAALDPAAQALALAPAGTATVRIHAIRARAYSYLNNGRQAAAAAGAARAELEAGHDPDDLHDVLGGEFSFDAGRLARCLGSTYVQLEQPDPAVTEAHTALEFYQSLPEGRRFPKIEAEALIDLACAYLLRGDLSGAEELLNGVFSLAAGHRIEGVTKRLLHVRKVLVRPQLVETRAAGALGGQIEDFLTTAPRRTLPALPPGMSSI
jgi:hypothetical protein